MIDGMRRWDRDAVRLAGLTALLVAMSTLALGLLAVRHRVLGSVGYWFLVWNLLLAWIPYLLSLVLATSVHRAWLRIATAGAWFVFLPNAPYLLTDVIHLRYAAGPVGWLDVVLVVTFVINGLMLGFVSLLLMHGLLLERIRPMVSWITMATVVVLCSFGIALGRIERWNSWDVIHHPHALARSVVDTVIHPSDYPVQLGVTMAVAALLAIGYLFMYALAGGPLRVATGPRDELSA